MDLPTLYRAKCPIVGDSCVGKTALVQQFQSDGSNFPKNYTVTTSVDIYVKSLIIPDSSDTLEIYLYDCAGKAMYADFVAKFWKGAEMFALVYDMTSEPSFNSCVRWLQRIGNTLELSKVPGVLIANKSDYASRRVLSSKAGEDWAHSNRLGYYETSAKDYIGVEAPFQYLARELLKVQQTKGGEL